MDEPEPDRDFTDEVAPARARRALAIIAASVVVIAASAVAYVRPVLFTQSNTSIADSSATAAPYHVVAVDFVDPSTGWVVVDFASGDFAILHTIDGGYSWSRELSGAAPGNPRYVKFFDAAVGVFALVGAAPHLYRTDDGGKSWVGIAGPRTKGLALSWSFVDSYFGWVLVSGTSPATPLPAYLYRTEDGGASWTNLGTPVGATEQAFEVNFSYFTTGWLTSANDGAFAYKTTDYGSTWTRVPLPAPRGGWPQGGKFLVAVQPTSGVGAVASVVFIATLRGRKGAGATIRDFPPLTLVAFDGGVPVTYVLATAVGMKNLGPVPQVAAPNQTELSTTDNGGSWSAISPPSGGAIGYFDAARWWWIGHGESAASLDGGMSWSAPKGIDSIILPLSGSLEVLDSSHAWFAGSAGSNPVLGATADGGWHWRVVVLPPTIDRPTS